MSIKLNENNFVKTLEVGREFINNTVNEPTAAPTALELVNGLHDIGVSLRNNLSKEDKDNKLTKEVISIFDAVSATQITDDDVESGKERVDGIILRNAIGYGVLSGLSCTHEDKNN